MNTKRKLLDEIHRLEKRIDNLNERLSHLTQIERLLIRKGLIPEELLTVSYYDGLYIDLEALEDYCNCPCKGGAQ